MNGLINTAVNGYYHLGAIFAQTSNTENSTGGLTKWLNNQGGLGKLMTGAVSLALVFAAGTWAWSNIGKLREARNADEKKEALVWCIVSCGVCGLIFFALSVIGINVMLGEDKLPSAADESSTVS